VAECYHRIVSDPRHQGTHTFEDAIAELRRCSGTQFDPKIVTAFLNWLETRGDRPEQQGRCHPRKV